MGEKEQCQPKSNLFSVGTNRYEQQNDQGQPVHRRHEHKPFQLPVIVPPFLLSSPSDDVSPPEKIFLQNDRIFLCSHISLNLLFCF